MSLWPRILDVLADGPGTAAEVAADLELDSRHVAVNLRAMWVWGKLTRELFHPSERGPSIRRSVWMYSVLDADLVKAPRASARR